MAQSYFGPALYLSDILNIKLAYKRYKLNNDKSSLFPFSGFPHTQLDKYLKILVQDLGHTVVLVEEYQRESAADLLPRQVGRVVTPGTLVDESWMNGDESRYLLAIAVGDTTPAVRKGENVSLALSLAYTDVSTGEFFAKDTTLAQMEDELARIAPREVVLDKSLKKLWLAQTDKLSSSVDEKGTVEDLLILLRVLGVHVSFADPYQPPELDRPAPFADLPAPYPSSLEGLAISLLRHHLQFALRDSMPELPSEPNRQFSSEHMQIDAATLHALEIRHAIRPGGLVTANESRGSSPLSARGTLLSVLNATITPSGHRLLIRSLTTPSTSLNVINSRLALVQAFVDREELRTELRGMIKSLGDIVRTVQRFRARGGDGRNIWEVGRWIRAVSRVLDRIRHELSHETSLSATGEKRSKGVTRLQDLLSLFQPLDKLLKRIEESIDEEAVLRGLEAGENSEEAEGEEVRGEVPEEDQPLPKKKSDKNAIKREVTELAREEKEDLMWWIRPKYVIHFDTKLPGD
jgi:DNA mismatch repair ATPase MutS